MELHLSPELEEKVNRAATENHNGAAEYVQQLVELYVDHDAWFREKVRHGINQLNRGESLSHDEVAQRIQQVLPL